MDPRENLVELLHDYEFHELANEKAVIDAAMMIFKNSILLGEEEVLHAYDLVTLGLMDTIYFGMVYTEYQKERYLGLEVAYFQIPPKDSLSPKVDYKKLEEYVNSSIKTYAEIFKAYHASHGSYEDLKTGLAFFAAAYMMARGKEYRKFFNFRLERTETAVKDYAYATYDDIIIAALDIDTKPAEFPAFFEKYIKAELKRETTQSIFKSKFNTDFRIEALKYLQKNPDDAKSFVGSYDIAYAHMHGVSLN